jgi:hypothetical protein
MEEITGRSPKKKYKKWTKEVRDGDSTKRVEVEEVSNGFIITIEKYGDVDGKYESECTKKISATNPFEKKPDEDDESFDGLMKSATNSMDNY